jgi:hypothetical protein
MKLYGKELKKEEIRQYGGNMHQFAGARELYFKGGKAEGIKVIEVKTGSGFRFVVVPDRGMDILDAEYCGKPLAWMCKNGVVSPQYFENGGDGFFRSFNGGLMTTCGLTHVGPNCVDENEVLGIHGRISHIPAEKYSIDEYWEEDDYFIKIIGYLRESCLYAENLVLKREIICKAGDNCFRINDTITNDGYIKTPFMMFYHINFGYPVVSEDTVLYTSSNHVEEWGEEALKDDGKYFTFEKPTPNYKFRLFLHHMNPQDEYAYVGLINKSIDFGGYVRYSPKQMPFFNEWKMMGQQDYVVGLEPGINIPEGRIEARKNNRLIYLEPGESYEISFEIGALTNKNEIGKFKI